MTEKKTFRVISQDLMLPGEKSCNARRVSRDGYCQSPGVAAFSRCMHHGGGLEKKAVELFKKALPMDKAQQLDALIQDTLSMDNELASAKSLLLQELENYNRATHYYNEFVNTLPARPVPDESTEDFEIEMSAYKIAVDLHMLIIEKSESMMQSSFKNSQNLIRILSDGVAKNARIKEGSKFQLDVKQKAKLLRVQLEAHKVCKGCQQLPLVVRHIKEHTKDIPLSPNFSKRNKEAIGRRAYQEMMDEVSKKMPNVEDAEIIEE